MWTCPECGYNVQDHLDVCWNCGFNNPNSTQPVPSPVILTTAPYLDGYRVTQTLDIITAECVFGINIFRDMLTALSDVFGGRSETTQNILREARKTCLSELRKEANSIGADAVIAVNLAYNEFSGGGKSMLFLVGSGTAVKIERIQKEEDAS
jgi:uncharacterized protein YbjQ (UPF0145 family)